jgi:hypothetical protein
MKIVALIAASMLLLAGCQQSGVNGISGEPQGDYGTADTTGVAGPASAAPKLVKRAELQFEVGDVQQGSQALGRLVRGMGGSLSYVRLDAEETASRSLPKGSDSVQLLQAVSPKAQLTVRVPAQHLEEFLYGAAQLSSFLRFSELRIDDQTLNYLESQWRSEARRKVLAAASGRSTKRIDSAGLAITDDIIGNRLLQREIDGQVQYSTVNLALTQAPVLRRTVIVNSDLDAYALPFPERLKGALAGGWRIFENLLLAGAQAWTLLLLAIGAWFGYRKWLRRQAVTQPRATA